MQNAQQRIMLHVYTDHIAENVQKNNTSCLTAKCFPR